jgi:GntR family transcriptional regulator
MTKCSRPVRLYRPGPAGRHLSLPACPDWHGDPKTYSYRTYLAERKVLQYNRSDDYPMNNSPLIQRPKPISQQVEDLLRERIQNGTYPPDIRMPSEEHLADELQVSRASIRTAMASLAAEGYIIRRHGDGTYVQPHTLEMNLHPLKAWDIARQIQERGQVPTQQIIRQGLRPAQQWEMIRLRLEDGEEVFSIERVFFADGTPVALISTVVRRNALSASVPEDVVNLPPVDFLGQLLRTSPRDGQIHFSAISAAGEIASRLGIEPGQLLLKMDSLIFDTEGHPIIIDTEYYLGQDGFRMHLNLNKA